MEDEPFVQTFRFLSHLQFAWDLGEQYELMLQTGLSAWEGSQALQKPLLYLTHG